MEDPKRKGGRRGSRRPQLWQEGDLRLPPPQRKISPDCLSLTTWKLHLFSSDTELMSAPVMCGPPLRSQMCLFCTASSLLSHTLIHRFIILLSYASGIFPLSQLCTVCPLCMTCLSSVTVQLTLPHLTHLLKWPTLPSTVCDQYTYTLHLAPWSHHLCVLMGSVVSGVHLCRIL